MVWAGRSGFQMLKETRYTQTGSAAGTGIHSSDAKWPGREADHSSPSCAGVKKEWMLTSIAPVGIQGMLREIFNFTVDIWRSSQHLQDEDASYRDDRNTTIIGYSAYTSKDKITLILPTLWILILFFYGSFVSFQVTTLIDLDSDPL